MKHSKWFSIVRTPFDKVDSSGAEQFSIFLLVLEFSFYIILYEHTIDTDFFKQLKYILKVSLFSLHFSDLSRLSKSPSPIPSHGKQTLFLFVGLLQTEF